MPFLLNKSGVKILVSSERIPELISRGFKRFTNWLTVSNSANKSIFIERPMGGLGDMISIKPVVDEFSRQEFQIIMSIPARYFFIFRDIQNVTLNDYEILNLKKSLRDKIQLSCGYYLDLWCPAGEAEQIENYRITKSRIDNFWEAAKLNGGCRVPVLQKKEIITGILENNGKKNIGIQPASANKSKDWPFPNFVKLAELLVKDYNVYCFDEIEALPVKGVKNFIRMDTGMASNIIGNLDLMIAPDSGWMWGALAQEVKTVALFGPTNGQITLRHFDGNLYRIINHKMPEEKCFTPCYYHHNNRYYCKNRIGDCMQQISVDEVYQAIKEFI
jgi:hypothetical protein